LGPSADWIAHAPNDALNPGENKGAGTHGTGLFGDVHYGSIKAPILKVLCGLGDGKNFSMSGGIIELFGLVVCFAYDLIIKDNHGATGNFTCFCCSLSFLQCYLHIKGIGVKCVHGFIPVIRMYPDGLLISGFGWVCKNSSYV
jgi:hypothetical protein